MWTLTVRSRGEGPLGKLEHKWIGTIVADDRVIEERRLSGRRFVLLGLVAFAFLFPVLYQTIGPGLPTYILPTVSSLTFILLGLPLARARSYHVNFSEFIDKADHQKWVGSGLLDEAIQDTFAGSDMLLQKVPKWPYFLFYRLDDGLNVNVTSSKARQQFIVTVEVGGISPDNHLMARQVQEVLDGIEIVGG